MDCGDSDLMPHCVQPSDEPLLKKMLRNIIRPFSITITAATLFAWVISDDWVAKVTDLSQIRE